jgi:hypothetical protein
MSTQRLGDATDTSVVIPRQRGVPPEPAPAGRATRRDSVWAGPLAAVFGYAVLRAIGLAVLAVKDHHLRHDLLGYDVAWYVGIAEHGYAHTVTYAATGNPLPVNLAFFPLYPALIAAVAWALPVSAPTAAIVVAWTFGLVAAAGLYAVGTAVRDRRTGILLALLWAVLPHALVQSMGYSETLFTALAAWSLWAVLRDRWLTAGALCVLAGLTRPTAAALVAAVGLAALVAVIRNPRQWRPWVAGAMTPLGLLAFMGWVGWRLHRADGYFYVQNRAWQMGFDGGANTLHSADDVVLGRTPLALTMTTAVLAVGVVLLVVALGARLPWPLLVFAGVAMVVVLTGDGYYWAKARLLMPAFPLLLPVAVALARTRNRVTPYAVVGALTALSAAYGVYLIVGWKHSP